MIPTAKMLMSMMERMIKITKGKVRGKSSINIKKSDILWADVVLFVRGADPYMEKIAKAAASVERYCIMYLDDDLLNVPYDDDVYKTALKGCLNLCNLLWSSNPNILKKYSEFMRFPNSIEEIVFDPIDELLPINEKVDTIKIVYAGSPSHVSNLQRYVIPALNNIYEKYKNIEVNFVGIKEDELKGLLFPTVYVPWFNDLNKYKEYIAQNRYHIGLAVVEDSEFFRCKFYNKFIEYSKMGVIGIYSDCEPYKFVVKDHVNGLLCKNTLLDWEKNIGEAISDSELRNRCIHCAQDFIRKEFDMNKVLKRIVSKVPALENYKAPWYSSIEYVKEKLYIRIFNYVVSTKLGYGILEIFVAVWHLIKGEQ